MVIVTKLNYNMKNLKHFTMDEPILSYWGMDDANEMECEKTLVTEKDYCETFKFNWAEWYIRRRELYNRENEEPMFGNH
jgi:hypothetical protein